MAACCALARPRKVDPAPESPGACSRRAGRVAHCEQTGRVIQFNEEERRMAGWMRAAQAGDRLAYDRLLRASIPHIRIAARRKNVPEDLLDDVVQETLIAVHLAQMTYDPDRPFAAWLRTIAQRRAIDLMRNKDRSARREAYEPYAFENHADPSGNPEDELDHAQRKQRLATLAASLPARQREAVQQLALEGKSLPEAASATGQTPGALAVNLHRAAGSLRTRIAAM
ncbi:MAG TPA: sigma-70 family RNA polymerase sigma factor [Xanthobacteraceae bacterium]|nr:sigma-70 family RNA polymerase sigma factor [Xanthobacteraceae bacterium]